jgi:hypothetical protein
MAIFSELQKQYVFDPQVSVRVFSAMEQFYSLICTDPPKVNLSTISKLTHCGNRCFGSDPKGKVGQFFNKSKSGGVLAFVGFDFELGKNPEYEDYIFGVSITKKCVAANYNNQGVDSIEHDEWITVKLEPGSLKSPQIFYDTVEDIATKLIK